MDAISVPKGKLHYKLNNVVLTSMRRDHVASTSVRRHFYVMCLLGATKVVSYHDKMAETYGAVFKLSITKL